MAEKPNFDPQYCRFYTPSLGDIETKIIVKQSEAGTIEITFLDSDIDVFIEIPVISAQNIQQQIAVLNQRTAERLQQGLEIENG